VNYPLALIRFMFVGVLATSVLITPTSAVAQATSAERGTSQGAEPDTYRIGAEDLLLISVWKNESLSRTVPVRPDGKISLPLLNDVQAGGLTTLELREVLARKLSDYIPNPEVSVIVSEIRSLKVSVIGEVTKPGRFELKSWATVLDLLALAGGFTQYASRSRIFVLRQDGGSMKRIPFNYNRVAAEQENFYVRNGDIVVVP
jgi:polysaccharide biosynthesis/export protein